MNDNTPDMATFIPRRAMVIAAHPDDIEFGPAGTVARWTRGGAKVSYVLCTDGDGGITTPGVTRAQAAEIRRAEQVAAARVLGVAEVIFLGYPDGLVFNTLELRRKLVYQIRRFKPEALMTNDPTVLFASDTYINHPDHRAVGLAALDAVFPAAGMPLVFPEMAEEGVAPHCTPYIFVSTWGEGANTYIDVSDTIDLKICALQAHVSQVGGRDIGVRIRESAAERGKSQGIPFAETFRVISLPWGREENQHVPPAPADAAEPCAEVGGEPVVIRLNNEGQ